MTDDMTADMTADLTADLSLAKRVLGLSAGARGGSAEIALKEALRGAEDAGATVELVRIDDLDLSVGPNAGSDDAQWFWDRLMDSDALIVSTPIYSRTVPGRLRLLGDKISGPQADVVFTSELLKMRAEGADISVDFGIDERLLRPRVAGFIAVGGSIPLRWKTLALPLLHTLTASAQIAVVDQVEFAGAGSPSSIVLDPAALARSRRLGTAVGEQAGRSWDAAEYVGEPGLCPLCQLSVIVIRPDGVECASCGAVGTFRVEVGRPVVDFPAAGRARSVLTLAEKLDHFHEVQATAAAHAGHRDTIDSLAAEYAAWDPSISPPKDRL
jgi:multimeric flavodoxin WrbA